MPIDSLQTARLDGAWGTMGALASSDGSATLGYPNQLAGGKALHRDRVDAVHFLCVLHGRHPGVIDHALSHARLDVERGWIESAAEAFVGERAYLARLVAAAGPLPSTPGHRESEAAAAAQRHALDMLARSDRAGCATGAALALAIDWTIVRTVLDAAAASFGMEPPPVQLPLAQETVSVIDALVRESRIERAILFGAQQLFAQHRGLWSLLEARASARSEH